MPETDMDRDVRRWMPLALKIVNERVRHQADRDDAYSDALMALWRALEHYDPGHGYPLQRWLASKMLHGVLDGMRLRNGRDGRRLAFRIRMARLDHVCDESLGHRDSTLRDHLIAPVAAGHDQESFAHLLRGLTAAERRMLTAYYRDGRTMAEIAASLGLTDSAISQRMTRALAFLRYADRRE